MNEETFLQAIRESPDEPTPRLIYADWLEEQGDWRCELVRADEELLASECEHAWDVHARGRRLAPLAADLTFGEWFQFCTPALSFLNFTLLVKFCFGVSLRAWRERWELVGDARLECSVLRHAAPQRLSISCFRQCFAAIAESLGRTNGGDFLSCPAGELLVTNVGLTGRSVELTLRRYEHWRNPIVHSGVDPGRRLALSAAISSATLEQYSNALAAASRAGSVTLAEVQAAMTHAQAAELRVPVLRDTGQLRNSIDRD